MPQALIAIGSNLGEREALLHRAVELLTASDNVRLVVASSLRETTPVGGPVDQPDYLNGAVLVETSLSPQALFSRLMELERSLGRVRGEHWGPRTIDLDLLLYDDVVLQSPELTLPHPRMVQRQFVLAPAAEIAGDMIDPVTGLTIIQLLEQLSAGKPMILSNVHEAQRWVLDQRRQGKRIGVTPTMGALHAGHMSLVERSRRECDTTVVTIFVNPMQFAPTEDFSRYPRQLERDLDMLAPLGVDLIFVPTVEEMYPSQFATTVEVRELTDRWEGAVRPEHFVGVTTVVLKLLNIIPANRAYFGQKDYQQYVVVRQMAADLNLPTEIVACPIIRETDGLAMSSRNAYLSADDRRRAVVLSHSLRAAREMFADGERRATKIRDAVRRTISDEASVQLDYVAVVDGETLEELRDIRESAVVLVAARGGATRLIDNEILTHDVK
ncbi:MAG: pantoate--beta-alanine ligase [Pirellulales bacterium]|nr:pantoate--beta-alanine ligase [Pirellulales bacterium]